MKCWKLKKICARSECSPVVFGNCLPIGIKNEVKDKRAIRMRVGDEDKRKHVRTLFSLGILADRVEMAIMSGVCDDVFDASREAVISECRRQDVQVADVPFLYGGNRPAIRQKLTEEDWAKIRGITSEFLTYCGKQ